MCKTVSNQSINRLMGFESVLQIIKLFLYFFLLPSQITSVQPRAAPDHGPGVSGVRARATSSSSSHSTVNELSGPADTRGFHFTGSRRTDNRACALFSRRRSSGLSGSHTGTAAGTPFEESIRSRLCSARCPPAGWGSGGCLRETAELEGEQPVSE